MLLRYDDAIPKQHEWYLRLHCNDYDDDSSDAYMYSQMCRLVIKLSKYMRDAVASLNEEPVSYHLLPAFDVYGLSMRTIYTGRITPSDLRVGLVTEESLRDIDLLLRRMIVDFEWLKCYHMCHHHQDGGSSDYVRLINRALTTVYAYFEDELEMYRQVYLSDTSAEYDSDDASSTTDTVIVERLE
uniref:ORF057 n=1 Tax=Spodoptera frugiperda granulovirus TaxID=307454 RepID=A0A346QVX7_9BBAC|nr:ORF057 [Spodoptera frugiperda granulovirus]